jgi:hypothetical protein
MVIMIITATTTATTTTTTTITRRTARSTPRSVRLVYNTHPLRQRAHTALSWLWLGALPSISWAAAARARGAGWQGRVHGVAPGGCAPKRRGQARWPLPAAAGRRSGLSARGRSAHAHLRAGIEAGAARARMRSLVSVHFASSPPAELRSWESAPAGGSPQRHRGFQAVPVNQGAPTSLMSTDSSAEGSCGRACARACACARAYACLCACAAPPRRLPARAQRSAYRYDVAAAPSVRPRCAAHCSPR